MENKQTAVEWLVANLHFLIVQHKGMQFEMIVKKAKAMEKEQMVRAFHAACKQDYALEEIREWAENYISSTYKNSKTPPSEHCEHS